MRSSAVYGLDVGSEPMRRATLDRARDAGQLATSPSLVLDNASGDRHGFFVVFPVYRRGAPQATVDEKRDALIGFVNAVFQTGAMLETILARGLAPDGLDLFVFSHETADAPLHVHASRAGTTPTTALSRREVHAGPHWSAPIRVGDRDWQLTATPTTASQLSGNGRAYAALMAGLVITSLVVWHMLTSIRHTRRVEMANNDLARARAALAAQNTRFASALDNMTEGLCLFDADERLIVCNPAYIEMYDLDPGAVHPGMSLAEIVELRTAAGSNAVMPGLSYLEWRKQIANGQSPPDSTIALQNGRTIEIHYRAMPGGGWVATHEDVTERRKLSENLADRTALLQAIVDNCPGGISYVDNNLRVVICNDSAQRMLELPDGLFAGEPPRLEDVLRIKARRGEYGPGDVEAHVAAQLARAGDRSAYSIERRRPDGTVLDVRGMPIEGSGFITTYTDITERDRARAEIAHMALHDALTGLANRSMLMRVLEHRLDAGLSAPDCVALCLIDLDYFKEVNDTLGHPAGDRLLQIVADRLRQVARDARLVARMGGDEFAILHDCRGDRSGLAPLAQSIVAAIAKPYDIDGHQALIGASMGIAVAPADGLLLAELIQKADMALYAAKGDGRGTFHFFEADMDAQAQQRRAMTAELRQALASRQFVLHYQPIVRLAGEQIRGFEALLRWQHPGKGILSPGVFIALAEESGLILPIGEWAIREACSQAAKWPTTMRVAVNLSPAQFKSAGLTLAITRALADSGLEASRLELEINETALWEDKEASLSTLYRLRELGPASPWTTSAPDTRPSTTCKAFRSTASRSIAPSSMISLRERDRCRSCAPWQRLRRRSGWRQPSKVLRTASNARL
jgi:diguanylate cyclase (GGDEF)-like protein